MKDLAIKVPFTVFIITMLVVPVPPELDYRNRNDL